MNRLLLFGQEITPIRKLLLMHMMAGGGLTEYEATGNPAVFNTNVEKPLAQLLVPFTPVQGGTGDPSPSNVRPITGWTGVTANRTGKNMFNFDSSKVEVFTTSASTERSGIRTGINYGKVTIKANVITEGTYTNYNINYGTLKDGVVTVVNGIAATSGLTPERTVDLDGDELVIVYALNNNSGFITEISKYNVQIEAADSVSTYAPYSGNSYPVTFPAMGKNLWYLYANGYYSSSGGFSLSNTNGCSEKIPVTPGQKYTFGAVNRGSLSVLLRGYYFNELGSIVGSQVVAGNQVTTTVPEGAVSVALWFSVTGNTEKITQEYCDEIGIQLVKGETLGTFEPYTNTVYGGSLDVVTGELTVTHAVITYDGSEDEEWAKYGTGSASSFAMRLTFPSQMKAVELHSNYLKWISPSATCGNNDNWISCPGSYAYVVTGITSITTVDNWKTYLSQNNLQVLYELSTPITYQLTPQQITTLIGDNTIWTDTNGENTIKYLKKG